MFVSSVGCKGLMLVMKDYFVRFLLRQYLDHKYG